MGAIAPVAGAAPSWQAFSTVFKARMSGWRSNGAPASVANAALKAMEAQVVEPPGPSSQRRARISDGTGSSSSSSSSSADSSEASSSSGDVTSEESDAEPEDAIALAEFAHGSERDHAIHFVDESGELPWCARNVHVEPEGFGLGWADLRSRKREVCHHCLKRFSAKPEDVRARLAIE